MNPEDSQEIVVDAVKEMTIEEMFDTNGYYTDIVDGQVRYVTTDAKGRAVIGPRSRRKVAKLFRRGPVGELRENLRHLAADVAIWSVCLSVSAIALKAAWFVVGL